MRARVPPGPTSLIPGKILFDIVRAPLQFTARAARTYGDIVHFRVAGRSQYLLNHPDYIKEVMLGRSASFTVGYVLRKARVVMGNGIVNSEGTFHARQRRLVQRSFHKQRIADYAATMAAYAQQLSGEWQDGEERDIHRDMVRLTLRIVMKTLFNTDGAGTAEAIGSHFRTLTNSSLLLYMLPYPETLMRFPVPTLRRVVQALQALDNTIYRMVEEHRQSGKDQGDLLSAFIAARDVEGDGGGMTDRQIRDECFSAFAAGHETTSNGLAWCLYLLSQHADVEQRLYREVTEVLNGRTPGFADYAQLPYTKSVFAESLRLYPPAWHLSRQALEDVELGGYTIPAGSIVLMQPWLVHRDPRYFPDPDRFDPERFAPDAPPRAPFSYFPFGGGPRSCVGEGFAWIAGVLILAVLVRDWVFRLKHDRTIEPEGKMILRPKGGVPMIVRKRRSPSAGERSC